jgi:hypothetical protein
MVIAKVPWQEYMLQVPMLLRDAFFDMLSPLRKACAGRVYPGPLRVYKRTGKKTEMGFALPSLQRVEIYGVLLRVCIPQWTFTGVLAARVLGVLHAVLQYPCCYALVYVKYI